MDAIDALLSDGSGDGANFQGDAAELYLTPFRITVIGTARSGKTALISGFVNSFCPTVHVKTDAPALYYKTLCLPLHALESGIEVRVKGGEFKGKEGTINGRQKSDTKAYPVLLKDDKLVRYIKASDLEDKNEAAISENILPVLAEIEDTVALSAIGDGRAMAEALIKKAVGDGAQPSAHAALQPRADEPICGSANGFMIVLDTTEANCVEEAMAFYNLLKTYIRKSGVPRVVCFVANKIDYTTDHLLQRKLELQDLVSQDKCRVETASMYDLRSVKHLFRGLLKELAKQHLQHSDGDGRLSGLAGQHSSHGPQMSNSASDKQNCEVQ